MTEPSEVKRQQRAMWTVGDYDSFAATLQPASDSLVARAGIGAGDEVLDVATGTGNAAIAAARVGALVTGLDLTPELFAHARRRAADAGFEIEWIEGDAERLPFPDQAFDGVLSVFGAMFAPDHRRTAQELVRVCRPGGLIGVCAWTPAGVFAQMIRLFVARIAPPPDFKPPALWGHEEYVSGLFDDLGVGLEFALERVAFERESAEGWVDYLCRVFGPAILVQAALEPTGEWDALRGELVDIWESGNTSTDGGFLVQAEYLTTIVRR